MGACGARGACGDREKGDDENHQESVMGGGALPAVFDGVKFIKGLFTVIEQVVRKTMQMMQVIVRVTDSRATMAIKAFL